MPQASTLQDAHGPYVVSRGGYWLVVVTFGHQPSHDSRLVLVVSPPRQSILAKCSLVSGAQLDDRVTMIAHQGQSDAEEARRDIDRSRRERQEGSWGKELQDVLRAISGGFIFATPLLYTMEMWWIGTTAELWKLMLFLGVAALISLGLARSRSGGFKEETGRFARLEQAVDGVALGLIGAVIVLAVLNRIQLGDPLGMVLGKVIVQAVPICIGAAVANAIFGRHGERSREGDEESGGSQSPGQAFIADFGATIIGAIFIAFSIAPTDEVPTLAAGLDYVHALALIALSLLLTWIIVFVSGFGTGQHEQQGPFQSPLTETVLAYLLSLLVALVSLFLFDRIEWGDPLGELVAMVLVLGLPAAVGGAAGRLVV
jgi:putative integral membrane protein (TIGR02587 family)